MVRFARTCTNKARKGREKDTQGAYIKCVSKARKASKAHKALGT